MDSRQQPYAEQVGGVGPVDGASGWSPRNPRTGEELPVRFRDATREEVRGAVGAAAAAFAEHGAPQRAVLAALLQAAAADLEADDEALVELVDTETALGAVRIGRELTRTIEQLRLFAREADEGWHVEATISPEDPDAPGGARGDLRRMLVPVGPVGVFGASNFPLAFSVAGGDTASALAAGCPVVVKAHPAHPGTSERVARAMARAVEAAGLPAAWFAMVQGRGHEVGQWLVTDPQLEAVGFTGSLAGGRALADLAAGRERPIPVYAEMGSLNPMFVTSAALAARAEAIAEAFVGSVVTNGGQLCTKPGLIFVPGGDDAARFTAAVQARISAADPGPLVSEAVLSRLDELMRETPTRPGVEILARGPESADGGWRHPATVLRCHWSTFAADAALSAEHFGPVAIVVECDDEASLVRAAQGLEGTLAAVIHAEQADSALAGRLRDMLARRAGRVVYNGVPTGVAVAHATNHGGPYPAASTALHTSVGTTAVRRFLRPVCYQQMPDDLLPPDLRDANPLGLLRNIDGEWTRDPVRRQA